MVGIYNNPSAKAYPVSTHRQTRNLPNLAESDRLIEDYFETQRATARSAQPAPPPPAVLQRPKQNVDLVTPFSAPEDVAEVQRMLKMAGFDPGKIDGKFGKRTRAAVMEFQKANGLKVDGKVGMRTLGKLNSAIPYMAPNHQAGQAWQAQYPGNEAWAEYEGEEARLPRARPGPGLRG